MAKLHSSSNPGPNPVPSPSSPSSPLMQDYKQGSSVLLLLLHHQSHQLQLILRNWKHSHVHVDLAWPGLALQLDTDYRYIWNIWNIWRCVLVDSWIYTEYFLAIGIYIPPINWSLRGQQPFGDRREISAAWSSMVGHRSAIIRRSTHECRRVSATIVRRSPTIADHRRPYYDKSLPIVSISVDCRPPVVRSVL